MSSIEGTPHGPVQSLDRATSRRGLLSQMNALPAGPLRMLRYKLGQLAFGKRPFATLLEENHWETRLTKAA